MIHSLMKQISLAVCFCALSAPAWACVPCNTNTKGLTPICPEGSSSARDQLIGLAPTASAAPAPQAVKVLPEDEDWGDESQNFPSLQKLMADDDDSKLPSPRAVDGTWKLEEEYYNFPHPDVDVKRSFRLATQENIDSKTGKSSLAISGMGDNLLSPVSENDPQPFAVEFSTSSLSFSVKPMRASNMQARNFQCRILLLEYDNWMLCSVETLILSIFENPIKFTGYWLFGRANR